MAKKKPPKPQSGPESRPPALSIRASVDWREWLSRGAEHCRTDVAKLVDAAVIEYLKKRGFAEEPPKR